MSQIIVGLPGPRANLNKKKDKINTNKVLLYADIIPIGYDPENESGRIRIVNDTEINPHLVKALDAPGELNREETDIAITGEDCVIEENLSNRDSNIRKIGDLGYGKARLVIAAPDDFQYESLTEFFKKQRPSERKKPIIIRSEYVYLARQGIMENEGYRHVFGNKKPVIKIKGLKDGKNDFVQIIYSHGGTEACIADMIVEITETGKKFREYGLKELEEIMESSAGLYAGPSCVGWKEKKAEEIYEGLYNAVEELTSETEPSILSILTSVRDNVARKVHHLGVHYLRNLLQE